MPQTKLPRGFMISTSPNHPPFTVSELAEILLLEAQSNQEKIFKTRFQDALAQAITFGQHTHQDAQTEGSS